MDAFLKTLQTLPEVAELVSRVENGGCPAVLTGTQPVQRACVGAAVAAGAGRPMVFLCADEREARQLAGDLQSLTGETPVTLLAREWQFRPNAVSSREWERSRLAALHQMAAGNAPVVVATVDALLARTMPPHRLAELSMTLETGGRADLKELCDRLLQAGYSRCDQVEGVGQFALRGGILDVFSPLMEQPVRCEFFDDEIDSLGLFDPGTQRRTENVSSALLLPAAEVLPGLAPGGTAHLADELEKLAVKYAKKEGRDALVQTLRGDAERFRNGAEVGGLDRYLNLIYPDAAGGADYFNCDKLFAAGIWPITVATTILKPGGYNRLQQMVEKVEDMPYRAFSGSDPAAISDLAASALHDFHHLKAIKPLPSRKKDEQVPLLDCFTAPCKGGCPIEQDIPEYLELCRKGLYGPALRLITEKNALPFITGTICAHRCQGKCSRNFYEESVHIRETKLLAAEKGYNTLMASLRMPEPVEDKKVAIVGGGPTGIAAAYFLGREGVPTTIFERERKLGGVPRYVIPAFRISDEAIDKDVALMERYGVEVKLGKPAPSVEQLKKMGYTHILMATGAWKPGKLDIEGNVQGVIEWMKRMKKQVKPCLSGSIVVVGAGNTAMDAARVAKRMGAHATILYRRTKKFMPADEHELQLAIDEGVEFVELAAPVKQSRGKLLCDKMILGEPDESGRRSPVKSGEQFTIPCDMVISAVGEQVDAELMAANGIEMERKGPAFETNVPGVYCAGDAHRGPATVVEGIADAARFAEIVVGHPHIYDIPAEADVTEFDAQAKKGILSMASKCVCDGERCLQCSTVCENCVDSCPNRANVVIKMADGSHEIVHVDKMCNECGNCTQFCPYASEPCHDKFTLFDTREDMDESENYGVLFEDDDMVRLRYEDGVKEYDLASCDNDLPVELEALILTVRDKYSYLYL